jgi:hypothetical protein
MKNIDIPFNKETGEMVHSHYAATHYYKDNVLWRPNYVFHDTLTYMKTIRYNSSYRIELQSQTDGRIYIMTYTTFEKLFTGGDIKAGPTFEGNWTFQKRGASYGVVPYGS